MEESQIFKNLDIKRHKSDISAEFDLYFGQLKNKYDKCPIEINGCAYYNCKNPKAKTNCYRYYLELDIKNYGNGETLVVIMLNPSNTYVEPDGTIKVDDTVKNTVRIAYKAGYSNIIILNSFNYIDGDSSDAIKFVKQNSNTNVNMNIISNVLYQSKDIMFGWGTKIRQKDKNKILEIVYNQKNERNLWAFAWNDKKNCPYHPANMANNKKNGYPLTNFIESDGDLIPLNIDLQKNKYNLVRNNKK